VDHPLKIVVCDRFPPPDVPGGSQRDELGVPCNTVVHAAASRQLLPSASLTRVAGDATAAARRQQLRGRQSASGNVGGLPAWRVQAKAKAIDPESPITAFSQRGVAPQYIIIKGAAHRPQPTCALRIRIIAVVEQVQQRHQVGAYLGFCLVAVEPKGAAVELQSGGGSRAGMHSSW
jgi:hypothetical protein